MTKEERIKWYMSLAIPNTFKYSHVVADLDRLGYFTAPASVNHHGNVEGGLFDHSLNVTHELVRLTNNFCLDWERSHSPIVIGMFHDLCKCDDYVLVEDDVRVWENFSGETERVVNSYRWDYNPNKVMPGHGEKSIIMFNQLFKIGLTEEEINCIRWHMGAFDSKENWKYYTQAVKKYPNVLWTHTADMYASQVVEK